MQPEYHLQADAFGYYVDVPTDALPGEPFQAAGQWWVIGSTEDLGNGVRRLHLVEAAAANWRGRR